MSISELESKIRYRINSGRKQTELLGRTYDWNRLCSSLDIVGDTETALESYLRQPRSDDIGLCYLHVYGALQLLQTQQDAVDHICRALGIKAQNSPKLPHIREKCHQGFHAIARRPMGCLQTTALVAAMAQKHRRPRTMLYLPSR